MRKHADGVDMDRIRPIFSPDNLHRFILRIPFLNRSGSDVLCVIGQNPSRADQEWADNTIHFLERYVLEKHPRFSDLVVINLYSRIDTEKSYSSDLQNQKNEEIFAQTVDQLGEFLAIFGRLRNEGKYKFRTQAKWAAPLLKNKTVHKFQLNTDYAPHPGNPKILYSRIDTKLVPYNFSDVI